LEINIYELVKLTQNSVFPAAFPRSNDKADFMHDSNKVYSPEELNPVCAILPSPPHPALHPKHYMYITYLDHEAFHFSIHALSHPSYQKLPEEEMSANFQLFSNEDTS
jgi:hypothetical protein